MSVPSVEPRLRPAAASISAAAAVVGRRRPRLWIWLLGGVAVVAVVAVGYKVMGPKPPPVAAPASQAAALTVTAAPVEQGVVRRTLLVTGSLAAWDELPIGTQTSGLAIVEVLVDEGDAVKAGQLLARFDDSELKADLAAKEASLREAQATAEEALTNTRRAEELSKTGAISVRELDSRRATAATAQARVGVAEAARMQAQVRVKQTEVRAPTDGTITRRNARLGAVMSAGGTELFRLIREDRVELVADVPEMDLRDLVVGQPVSLSVDGSSEAAVGTIRLISPVVDPKTRLGTIKVDVPKSRLLRPGMFVGGRVETGTIQAPLVPAGALVYKDSKPLVFTLGEGDKVQMRAVETGPLEGGRVAILKGVATGDRVVVAGAGYLKDGDVVTVAAVPDIPVRPLPTQP
ncbi:efflux RND transporter periplasmic adaptor subunit [Oleisolibacter albus]|uniref:efflux RND transporter periplasmic adaptor subunit n=1 Tax=Oleisolibacter albus TaxID=2171757 RepID=UPI000DF14778|nr:efflux RND transporter periplasmic adaptor subunit [Oleisolibacter albus]